MKNYQIQTQMYKALMHPTRLAILDILRDNEQCVCHMEAVFGLRQAHISQHLMVLRDAGLVSDRREGWNVFYRVRKPEIYEVIDAMNSFCGDNTGSTVSAKPEASAKACLCPKCSAGTSPSSEKPDLLSMEIIQTSG